ncbi:MAG: flavodoxin family protein [Clostridiales Family XIII bacterium]|jgi:multimeric flavodoxin WrbA|nr:flavodoxin family protein [Clostridiales Family XIII bacterium]
MKIIVINGAEQKGCTYNMKEMFLDAVGRGHDVTEFTLPEDCPVFCTGCKACFYRDISVCPHREYTVPIWDAISAADLIVFTSPVYVFHATAQMKALLDHYGSKWMAHSPERQMFSKQAVIITNAAGMGMKNVARDIGDSLRYWGVARVFVIKQALFESRWELVAEKRKAAIKRSCARVSSRVTAAGAVKPSIGVKARFYIMRMAQRMIHKSQLKAGQPETKDHLYWKENGWLSGGKPWR